MSVIYIPNWMLVLHGFANHEIAHTISHKNNLTISHVLKIKKKLVLLGLIKFKEKVGRSKKYILTNKGVKIYNSFKDFINVYSEIHEKI